MTAQRNNDCFQRKEGFFFNSIEYYQALEIYIPTPLQSGNQVRFIILPKSASLGLVA